MSARKGRTQRRTVSTEPTRKQLSVFTLQERERRYNPGALYRRGEGRITNVNICTSARREVQKPAAQLADLEGGQQRRLDVGLRSGVDLGRVAVGLGEVDGEKAGAGVRGGVSGAEVGQEKFAGVEGDEAARGAVEELTVARERGEGCGLVRPSASMSAVGQCRRRMTAVMDRCRVKWSFAGKCLLRRVWTGLRPRARAPALSPNRGVGGRGRWCRGRRQLSRPRVWTISRLASKRATVSAWPVDVAGTRWRRLAQEKGADTGLRRRT